MLLWVVLLIAAVAIALFFMLKRGKIGKILGSSSNSDSSRKKAVAAADDDDEEKGVDATSRPPGAGVRFTPLVR